jgi:outer membrane protein, multidrug efflux system
MKRLLFIPLILSACVQGTNYERPTLAGLFSKKFKHASSTPTKQSLPDEWWKSFGSSTLNGLVSKALSANQDLAAAKARVDTSRALIGLQRSQWFPQINSASSMSTQRLSESAFGANIPPQFGSVGDLVKRDNFRSALEMKYELDLWGRVKRSVEAAEANARSATDSLSAQRLIIAADVARHYFLIRSLDSQLKVLQETIALREEAQKLQQSRFDGGMANEMDVTRARTEVALAKADLEALTRQRGSTEHALAVLCGQSPSSFSVAVSDSIGSPPAISSGLPSKLLQSRPDIAAAEAKLQAASAEIGVSKAEFFPAFSLLGSAGLESVAARDFLSWENRVLNVGPSVSLPVLNGGRLKSNLAAAKSRYDEALATYQQTILGALREVEDALLDLQAYGRQHAAIDAAQKAADETARLARVRYDKGLASYFEVVEADRTVLGTKLTLSQLDGQRMVSSVLLAKALGGGWKR